MSAPGRGIPTGGARPRLRRALGGALRLFAFGLIALASAIALLQLALPWLASDARRVERLLAAFLGADVEIDTAVAEWRGREAVLRLEGLAIGGREGIAVERAELSVDPLRLLVGLHGAAELRLHGLAIVAEWDGEALRLAGLPARAESGDWPGLLRLSVAEGRLAVRGLPAWPAVALDGLVLAVDPAPEGERWAGRARLPGEGGVLEFVFARAGAGQRAYLRVDAADLGRILTTLEGGGIGIRGGQGTLELWLELGPEGSAALAAEFALARIGLYGRELVPLAGTGIEPRRTISGLSGWLRAERAGARWRAVVGELGVDGRQGGELLVEGEVGQGYRLRAARLPIAPLASAAALAEGLPAALRAWLFASAPEGVLDAFEIHVHANRPTALRGATSGLRFAPALGLPGLGPLDLSFRGDAEGVVAELAARAARLDWPAVFPEALPLAAAELSLAAARDRVELVGEGVRLGALPLDLRVEYDPTAPERGLAAAVLAGESELAVMVPRLPYGIISPRTAGWLRRAMRAGMIASGRVAYQGRPGDWPFSGGEGGLRVALELRDGELAFHSRWPVAEIGAARLEFRDRSLRFAATAGQIAGLAIPAAEGEIPDLDRAELALRAAAIGSGEDLLGFLRASPLVHRYGPWLIGQRLEGTLDGEVELLLRVFDPAAPDEARGRIRLHGLTLEDARWGFALSALAGELRFDQEGLRAEALSARIGEWPIRIAIASGAGCADPAHDFEAEVQGRLGLAEVLALSGLAGRAPLSGSGSAEWRLSLALARGTAGGLRVRLASPLSGIALAGPAPFVKDAEAVWPLALDLQRSGAGGGRATLTIDPWLAAVWQSSAEGGAARVRLGGGQAALEPSALGLSIEGWVPALDLDPWLRGTPAALGPLAIDLATERLLLLGSDLGPATLAVERDGKDLRIALNGEGLAGEVRWRGGPEPRLQLALERLHWRDRGEGGETTAFDPRWLPEIDARIASLRLGEADLGEFRLETRNEAEGMRIAALEAKSDAFSLHGKGAWLRRGGAARTRLALQLTAPELARALSAFGFVPSVADGPVLVEGELEWPGSPLDLAVERLSGRLHVRSGPGRLLALEPGAGRLLGLVSLSSLPKRVMLDFRDVLAPGMSFDGFSGSFVFADGAARTDDFALQAPGARIEIRGSTDLRAREYDQRVEVRPEVGGVLPLLGALAAGAPGVAAGMLARNVLSGPLGSIGRAEYHLSGPWERPVLTRLAAAPRPEPHSR